jgi:hypothetical protein
LRRIDRRVELARELRAALRLGGLADPPGRPTEADQNA